jgi:hypothetical protein
MSDDILFRLHNELEGTTANSPAVCELLCEAAEEAAFATTFADARSL